MKLNVKSLTLLGLAAFGVPAVLLTGSRASDRGRSPQLRCTGGGRSYARRRPIPGTKRPTSAAYAR